VTHFAAYTAAETANPFQWAGQHPILPLSVDGSQLPFNTWFMGPDESALNGLFVGSSVFADLTNVANEQTDRHTNRPHYFVCSDRPRLAIAAIQPSNVGLHDMLRFAICATSKQN